MPSLVINSKSFVLLLLAVSCCFYTTIDRLGLIISSITSTAVTSTLDIESSAPNPPNMAAGSVHMNDYVADNAASTEVSKSELRRSMNAAIDHRGFTAPTNDFDMPVKAPLYQSANKGFVEDDGDSESEAEIAVDRAERQRLLAEETRRWSR